MTVACSSGLMCTGEQHGAQSEDQGSSPNHIESQFPHI